MGDWLGLAGARALVLGAGGIGGTCVRAMTALGVEAVLVDVDPESLEKAVADTADHPGTLRTVVADLRSSTTCRAVVQDAHQTLGGLDVFVHAVGHNERTPIADLTDEQFENVMTLNLATAFWAGQAAGRLMCEQGAGRMVFLSSVSGLLAHQLHAPYAASKGGLNQLVRVMAREWAGSGVGVNAVAPGYTHTHLTAGYLAKPGMLEEMTSMVPAGRLGTTEDLVGPVLFLASPQSAFVTGHILFVDGGRTLV